MCQHGLQRNVDLRYKVDALNIDKRSKLFYKSNSEKFIMTNIKDHKTLESHGLSSTLLQAWRYKNKYPIQFSKKGAILILGSDEIQIDQILLNFLIKKGYNNIYYKIHPALISPRYELEFRQLNISCFSDFKNINQKKFKKIYSVDRTSAFIDYKMSTNIPVIVFRHNEDSEIYGFTTKGISNLKFETEKI